jgi:PAS domain S-box-containing protein
VIAHGGRVIIEDVDADPAFAPRRAIAASAAFRAVQSTPLFASNGEPLGVISTYFRRPHRPSERDLRLTDLYARQAAEMIERERTQAALRRSEFYLAQGEKISHTGSWVWNIATEEVFWSHEQFRIYGLPPETKPSRELFWSVMHPEDRVVIRQRFEQAMQSRRDFEDHFRVCHADGTIRHVHALAQPVFNAAAELVEYVGTIADITERKLAEEGLRRVQHELGRVSRVMTMGELAASIAHEVNQPLAAVAASAGACMRWLAADPPNVGEATAVARSIARDAHRASEVIARIRAHLTGNETERSELGVADVIRDATSLVSHEARARGVTVFSTLATDLPKVTGDRIQLQQVVLNLAMNAIEAMRCVVDRRRILEIVAEATSDGHVCVKVRDTGPGLDPEHRDRIFDAFFSTKAQGMGMGLAISRSIIDSHGGRLWAEANPAGGETFQFTLPPATPASGVMRWEPERPDSAYHPNAATARGSATNARDR